MIELIAKSQGHRVLDFGAGAWLRYPQHVLETHPARELFAVEYAQAFRDDARALRDNLQTNITVWTPKEFRNAKSTKYDLVLLVNVLNTIPESLHRQEIFEVLAKRLNPLGLLVVYQRVWSPSENPPGALPYDDDGWFGKSPHHQYYTYRAKTGANWFTAQGMRVGLKPMDPDVLIKSRNTILKVWEKPFE